MTRVEPLELEQYGWTFKEKCRCTGALKYKYQNAAFPNYELEWMPRYYQFRIMNKNSTKVPLTKITRLEEILKGL